jgi:BirA family biotin operon repressor/biotin-[acetyl-CoA-carboxylase] ligase
MATPSKNIIQLESIGSTNSYLSGRACDLSHATVVSTYVQTAGRGQRGNTWESQPNKNLSFSVLLRPNNIIARQQFYISEAVSIAIVNTLRRYITNAEVAIKWPNDIYVGDMKICGILIENTLSGCNIAQSIVGVGLNINQREFLSDAPNPISLIHFTNSETSLDDILNEVTDEIISTFDHYDTSTQFDTLHDAYISMLWRRDGFHPYSTPDGTQFMARITNVAPDGILTLTDTHNTSRSFAFKEVQAIL